MRMTKNILQNIKGPSWSPKKSKQIEYSKIKTKTEEEISEIGFSQTSFYRLSKSNNVN